MLEESRKAERSEILSKLKSGMRLQGTVSSIVDFGAFVDLGGIDGPNPSPSSLETTSTILRLPGVGQEVEVEAPTSTSTGRAHPLVAGRPLRIRAARLVKKRPRCPSRYGDQACPARRFRRLREGTRPGAHPEMANKHVDQPSVTHVGDKVQVKVMEIDLDRRRISLSMKSAAETLGVEIEVTPLPSEKKDEETDAE